MRPSLRGVRQHSFSGSFRRTYSWAAVALLAPLGCEPNAVKPTEASTASGRRVVEAEEFVLLDPTGKKAGSWSAKDGVTRLQLQGTEGKAGVVIEAGTDGSFVVVRDGANKNKAMLDLKDDNPSIALLTSRGEALIARPMPDDMFVVMLRNGKGGVLSGLKPDGSPFQYDVDGSGQLRGKAPQGVGGSDSAAEPKASGTGGCGEGWSAGEKGICYRVNNLSARMGHTIVTGQVVFPRSYQTAMLGVALYRGGKVVEKCTAALMGVEKGADTPFEALCQREHVSADKVVVRIDMGM